ncbi:hypothetical protein SEA_CULVER_94 [Gordonia phage Culver]|nr:hypothetical protein SEA_CULVER_94 [Gordonia phage Culver]
MSDTYSGKALQALSDIADILNESGLKRTRELTFELRHEGLRMGRFVWCTEEEGWVYEV